MKDVLIRAADGPVARQSHGHHEHAFSDLHEFLKRMNAQVEQHAWINSTTVVEAMRSKEFILNQLAGVDAAEASLLYFGGGWYHGSLLTKRALEARFRTNNTIKRAARLLPLAGAFELFFRGLEHVIDRKAKASVCTYLEYRVWRHLKALCQAQPYSALVVTPYINLIRIGCPTIDGAKPS